VGRGSAGRLAARPWVGVTDVAAPAGGERTAYSEPVAGRPSVRDVGNVTSETVRNQWFGDGMTDVTPVPPGGNGQPKAPTGLIVACSLVGAAVLAMVFAGMGNPDGTARGPSPSTLPGATATRPTARPAVPLSRGVPTSQPSPVAALNSPRSTATDSGVTGPGVTGPRPADPVTSQPDGTRIAQRDLDDLLRHIGHRKATR
jgi:hypothetical protein